MQNAFGKVCTKQAAIATGSTRVIGPPPFQPVDEAIGPVPTGLVTHKNDAVAVWSGIGLRDDCSALTGPMM